MNDILEEIENIAPKGFVSESQKCGKLAIMNFANWLQKNLLLVLLF